MGVGDLVACLLDIMLQAVLLSREGLVLALKAVELLLGHSEFDLLRRQELVHMPVLRCGCTLGERRGCLQGGLQTGDLLLQAGQAAG